MSFVNLIYYYSVVTFGEERIMTSLGHDTQSLRLGTCVQRLGN